VKRIYQRDAITYLGTNYGFLELEGVSMTGVLGLEIPGRQAVTISFLILLESTTNVELIFNWS
jgi:hypothetical protein